MKPWRHEIGGTVQYGMVLHTHVRWGLGCDTSAANMCISRYARCWLDSLRRSRYQGALQGWGRHGYLRRAYMLDNHRYIIPLYPSHLIDTPRTPYIIHPPSHANTPIKSTIYPKTTPSTFSPSSQLHTPHSATHTTATPPSPHTAAAGSADTVPVPVDTVAGVPVGVPEAQTALALGLVAAAAHTVRRLSCCRSSLCGGLVGVTW